VQQDARTFAAWGVDYLKYDLCSGEWFYADADSVRRVYQAMGQALRATGRPIIYSLCEYGRFDVAAWGRSVGGHLWRTTGDIGDDYQKMASIGFDRSPKFVPGGPGGWNDPDMLEVGNGGMTATEYRTMFTLWAEMAAPLIAGNDLTHMSPQTLSILSNQAVIAVDQDPLGVQGHPVTDHDGLWVLTKPLVSGDPVIVLFNETNRQATISTTASAVGVAGAQGYLLTNLWSGAVTTTTADISAPVPPHGVVMLTVTPAG
jgi:alpha-galactosidase